MSELEKSLVHENDTKYFDESMQDSNHFVPISISSPIKPNVPFTQMGRQDNLVIEDILLKCYSHKMNRSGSL